MTRDRAGSKPIGLRPSILSTFLVVVGLTSSVGIGQVLLGRAAAQTTTTVADSATTEAAPIATQEVVGGEAAPTTERIVVSPGQQIRIEVNGEADADAEESIEIRVGYNVALLSVTELDPPVVENATDASASFVRWVFSPDGDPAFASVVFTVREGAALPEVGPEGLISEMTVEVQSGSSSALFETLSQQVEVQKLTLTRTALIMKAGSDFFEPLSDPIMDMGDMLKFEFGPGFTEGTENVTLVDNYDASRFEVLDQSPGSVVGDGEIELAIGDPGAFYVLSPLGIGENVKFGGVLSATNAPSVTEELTISVVGPDLTLGPLVVEPDAPNPGETVQVVAQVRNNGSEPSGRYEVSIRPTSGDASLGNPENVVPADGKLDGATVAWTEEALAVSEESIFSFAVRLRTESAIGDEVEWEVTLSDPEGLELPTVGTASITVGAGTTTDDEAPVDLTEEQLVRLIAFLVVLAILALAFGAVRLRSEQGSTNQEGRDAYLKSYVEGVTVIFLVAVIVILVMGAGLRAESGAGLLGVIAGYIFGRASG